DCNLARPMPVATLEVQYPRARGTLGLRGGTAPLSWARSLAPVETHADRAIFRVELPAGEILECKLIRDERDWASGRNVSVQAGETTTLRPYFDRARGEVEPGKRTIRSPELARDVSFRMFLPPSYPELEDKRYPVLYVQDGQALFGDSPDPIDGHSWRL